VTSVIRDWTSHVVDADGVRINVYRTGRREANPLVMAHSLGDDARCWWRVAEALENDFDIVMIDARNHGHSGTGPGGVSRMAADVAAVIDALGLDSPVLLGHSVGARTMAEFAMNEPDQVAMLVLVDPPWSEGMKDEGVVPDDRIASMKRWLTSLPEMSGDDLAALGNRQHPDWSADDFPAWIESKRLVRPEAADNLTGEGWAQIVPEIACPTLLVYGDAERHGMVTQDVAQQVKALNDQIVTCHIAGAGHNIHREDFDAFIGAITEFFDSE
jgi:N-formylmaleamate deformylase